MDRGVARRAIEGERSHGGGPAGFSAAVGFLSESGPGGVWCETDVRAAAAVQPDLLDKLGLTPGVPARIVGPTGTVFDRWPLRYVERATSSRTTS